MINLSLQLVYLRASAVGAFWNGSALSGDIAFEQVTLMVLRRLCC